MKSNICVVCVDKRYSRTISKMLANALDMFFADVNALIEFDLMCVEEVEKMCGVEYLQKIEYSKVKNVATYENTLFTLNCEMFGQQRIKEVVAKNALVVFVDMTKQSFWAKLKNQRLTKNDKQNQLDMYDDRTNLLREMSDICVCCDDLGARSVVSEIRSKILCFYKGKENGNR